MKKSLFSKDYVLLFGQLRRARRRAGLTQDQLAERLASTQSFVSKCERGERRLDIIELRAWCRALDVPFPAFVAQFERTLDKGKGS